MLLGVKTTFAKDPLPADLKMTQGRRPGRKSAGEVSGSGSRFAFDYKGPDTAIAINRLLKDGAQAAFDGPSHVRSPACRAKVEQVAKEFGLAKAAGPRSGARRTRDQRTEPARPTHGTPNREARTRNRDPTTLSCAPRSRCISPGPAATWTKGWTRWVLEQYEFNLTSIHNADIRAGKLRQKFDAIIIADQSAAATSSTATTRPRSGRSIAAASATAGVDNLKQFIADGGTLVTMGERLRPRDREAADSGAQSEERADARPALRAGRDSPPRSRRAAPDGLRHGGRHLRVLHQQPVLLDRRRLRVAEDHGRRPLSEHRTSSRRAG